ncbi:MAG: SpoIIE family protein phosphatase [Crocinitomicaceae bacterium]|nr:SpoIIE family protein phosphatase [Crocinitomicaceae bacterium]
MDISKKTIESNVSKNGSSFILNKEMKVLGLPAEMKDRDLKAEVLKPVSEFSGTPMHSAYEAWKQLEQREYYFPFEHNGEDWWCVFQPYYIGNQVFYIGIVAPEKDFLESIKGTRRMIIASMLILVLFLGFVALANRRKRKMNLVLVEQKLMIEEKSKEITDSIKYASQIQKAIFPPSEMIKNALPDSFILYKPKDIVAGDFYWMETVGSSKDQVDSSQSKYGTILFAAADCTGHGVPGAMVSVMCNNGLNRSVREFGLKDPGQILDKTRELVIGEFDKSNREVKDGMDIALVSIEQEQEQEDGVSAKQSSCFKLKYAGANNPLWIIRKDSDVIEEIKADKQPVGNYRAEHPFTTHELNVFNGDQIYIFSDGYADQFGGTTNHPGGKKFKVSNLKKLFLSVKDLPMEEQKTKINQAFEAWRGDNEQVDDVVVFGVRI